MDRVSVPLLLLLLLAACEVEGRVRGRGRRVAGEQRLVPAWPGPYWDIPGQFCSATSPRLQCCLDRNDRWVGSHGQCQLIIGCLGAVCPSWTLSATATSSVTGEY